MYRAFTMHSAASLSRVLVLLLTPASTFAARALQPAELLAASYQANYNATYQVGDSDIDSVKHSRRAAQIAADAVAGANSREAGQARRSPSADEAALKAATAALNVASGDWQTSRMKFAYKDALDAAFEVLSKEKAASLDPSSQNELQRLPENLRPLVLRGAKIRTDRSAAKVAAAFAVARAVAQRIAAEESARVDAAADRK